MAAAGAPEKLKPRRLSGHDGEATYCIASRRSPGLIVSSGEDGFICLFDLRCKDVVFKMDVEKGPVSSICFMSGNEDVLYASAGNDVIALDVHMVSSWKPIKIYCYNKDEINQIAVSSKGYFLAAADDSGDVKIIDTRQQCMYKTLRSVHVNICSSVQFLPWKSWEVITGGLDAKLVMWDFSRGRPQKVVELGLPDVEKHESSSSGNHFVNPPFIHAIAIPEEDMMANTGKICAVARGDSIVDIIDLEIELGAAKLKSSQGSKKSQSAGKESVKVSQGRILQLDNDLGGHIASVSCVAFSRIGEVGKHIFSGGNDSLVKVWDWSKHLDASHDNNENNILNASIKVSKKVNWLCTVQSDSENLVVCDTSKVVKSKVVVKASDIDIDLAEPLPS